MSSANSVGEAADEFQIHLAVYLVPVPSNLAQAARGERV